MSATQTITTIRKKTSNGTKKKAEVKTQHYVMNVQPPHNIPSTADVKQQSALVAEVLRQVGSIVADGSQQLQLQNNNTAASTMMQENVSPSAFFVRKVKLTRSLCISRFALACR